MYMGIVGVWGLRWVLVFDWGWFKVVPVALYVGVRGLSWCLSL